MKRTENTAPKKPKKQILSSMGQRCLAEILAAEIAGTPTNAQTYRAHSPRRIQTVTDLERQDMLARDGLTYVVTFWGLLNIRNRQSQAALRQCGEVFKSLVKHYRKNPNGVLRYDDLEKRSGLTNNQAVQAIRLLNRSSASMGSCTEPQNLGVMPSERHVMLRSFENLKKETLRDHSRPRSLFPQSYSILDASISSVVSTYVEACESQEVRESWSKSIKRVSSDFDGAITSARTLVESVCRYVLEELGTSLPADAGMGQLYKAAVKSLQLDTATDSHPAVRQILGGCSGVVSGLAELRNTFSDAHGKGARGLKPARRHAELAVLIAGATSGFLLATLDAQRRP